MFKRVTTTLLIVIVSSLPATARQQGREKLDRVERELKSDVLNLV